LKTTRWWFEQWLRWGDYRRRLANSFIYFILLNKNTRKMHGDEGKMILVFWWRIRGYFRWIRKAERLGLEEMSSGYERKKKRKLGFYTNRTRNSKPCFCNVTNDWESCIWMEIMFLFKFQILLQTISFAKIPLT
jgi:hypothetical protein